MIEHPDFAAKLRELAEYIYDRCLELDAVPGMFDNCDNFSLPTAEDVTPWVETVKPAAAGFVAF
jgi:hypothetical protein